MCNTDILVLICWIIREIFVNNIVTIKSQLVCEHNDFKFNSLLVVFQEEEERELAVIFLQQVIRGRAIQNMVSEDSHTKHGKRSAIQNMVPWKAGNNAPRCITRRRVKVTLYRVKSLHNALRYILCTKSLSIAKHYRMRGARQQRLAIVWETRQPSTVSIFSS